MGRTTRNSQAKAAKAATTKSKQTLRGSSSLSNLQLQCKQNGLATNGSVAQIKDRLLDFFMRQKSADKNDDIPDEEMKQSAKRSKTGEAIAKEFVCPITLQLPFDPVTAEDGRVYERSAIQTHIDTSRPIKSPITNQRMGGRLFPHPQARNIIEAAIQNGDIPNDLAKAWKEKVLKKQEFESKKLAALAGNGKAALEVATSYHFGTELVKRDLGESYKYWKKAAQVGETLGLLMHGRANILVEGADFKGTGISCLTEAAAKGSSLACLYMGQAYKDGINVCINDVQAARYICKGLGIQDEGHAFVVSEEGRKYYQALLREMATQDAEVASYLSATSQTPSNNDNETPGGSFRIHRQLLEQRNNMDLFPQRRPWPGSRLRRPYTGEAGSSVSQQDNNTADEGSRFQLTRVRAFQTTRQRADGSDGMDSSRDGGGLPRNVVRFPSHVPTRNRDTTAPRNNQHSSSRNSDPAARPRSEILAVARSRMRESGSAGGNTDDRAVFVSPPPQRQRGSNNNNNSGGYESDAAVEGHPSL